MPKDRRVPSLSSDRSRKSPYPRISKNTEQHKPKRPSQSFGDEKEWEDVRCSICMEHPHNAILLLCSSHVPGCRPYICDTSYRHSNCLDQFCKSSSTTPSTDLSCPLCRGKINKWIVVEPARKFMNSKPRSCAVETCDFSGTYSDLRKHARLDHPSVRPAQADSERQRDWMRMERERDIEDFLSASQLESRTDSSDWPGWGRVPFDDLLSVFELEFEHEIGSEVVLEASQLESGRDWSDWPGLGVPYDDLSSVFETESESTLNVDFGIEMPFSFFDTSFTFGSLSETTSVPVSSGVDSFGSLFETTSVPVSSGVGSGSHNRLSASRTGGYLNSHGSRPNRQRRADQRRLRQDYD